MPGCFRGCNNATEYERYSASLRVALKISLVHQSMNEVPHSTYTARSFATPNHTRRVSWPILRCNIIPASDLIGCWFEILVLR